MTCSSCGSEVEAGAGFCHLCGAPVRAEPEAVVAGSASTGPLRFELEAGALELFFRFLITGLSMVFVFPAPWTMAWFSKWLAGQVRANNGQAFDFRGTAGNVWKLVAVYVLLLGASIGVGIAQEQDPESIGLIVAYLVTQLALVAMGWAYARWFIDHLELGGRSWRFDGSIWGYIGWMLLFYLSFITIIGWAWAMVGLYSWIADHVQDAGGKLRFLGAGHEVLWRTLAMGFSCLFIIPIPWAIKWYYGWFVSQLELTPDSQEAAVL